MVTELEARSALPSDATSRRVARIAKREAGRLTMVFFRNSTSAFCGEFPQRLGSAPASGEQRIMPNLDHDASARRARAKPRAQRFAAWHRDSCQPRECEKLQGLTYSVGAGEEGGR